MSTQPAHNGFSAVAWMARCALLIACILCLPAHGQGFRLDDIRGDDHGTGDVWYPNRDDIMEGDLDLVFLEAFPGDEGTWFRAGFANPIRDPSGVVTRVGQEPLDRLARHGFYTFNLDVYVDIDRKPGSGSIDTVPGRRVAIDPRDAWEKCIVLTPRPNTARRLLERHVEQVLEEKTRDEEGRITGDQVERIRERVQASVAERFFFPDRIRVRGREVRFFVPDSFLGGPARGDWTYTALVTGADAEQQAKVVNFSLEGFSLMTLPVERGRHHGHFGLGARADPEQPPVVDLLSATPGSQEAMLATYDVRDGRLATVTGTSPDDGPTVPALSRPAAPGGQSAAPAGASAVSGSASSGTEPAAAVASPAARRSIADRLRTLNALKDQGLITETEYQALRRKVLSEI